MATICISSKCLSIYNGEPVRKIPPRTKCKDLTYIVDAAFSSSPIERAKADLLLNSILPVIVCVIAAPLARELDVGRPRNMGVGIITMFVITMATGVYAVISSLQSISGKLSPSSHAIGIGVFFLAPLVVPVAEKIIESVRKIDVNAERKKRKVHHFAIEESEGEERVDQDWVKDRKEVGDDAGKMENGLKEIRGEAGEFLEIGVKRGDWSEGDAEKIEFMVIFLGLFLRCNVGAGVSEQLGTNSRVPWVFWDVFFGFFIIFVWVFRPSHAVLCGLLLLRD